MSESRVNFVSRALSGTASPEDIDHYIEQWHVNPGGLTLHDYLGLSPEEYALWLTTPEQLETILERRKVMVSHDVP